MSGTADPPIAGKAPGPPAEATPADKAARRPMGLRLQIALAMVLIAILGAITAYRGAIAEMDSALLEQKLDQGRLFELYFRQDRTDGALMRETLSIRQQDDERMARQLMQQADKARAADDTEQALRLDLEAQQEAAASRAIRQVYWILPTFDDDISIEQSLRRRAVQQLNSRGFDATWAAPPKTDDATAAVSGTDTIWPGLEQDIAKRHERAPWLAIGVMGFVLALVFLTIADVLRSALLKHGFFYFGTAFSLVPTALSIWTDPDVVPWFVGAALAFAALVLAGWLLGWLQGPEESEHHFHPAELERRGYTGAHLISRVVHDRFSQSAVLAIALAVFLSALVGTWFTTADTEARNAALKAVGFETDLLKRGSLFGALRTIVLGDIAQTLDQRARLASVAASAAQLPEADRQGATTGPTARMHTAKYTGPALEQILDRDDGIHGDPDFPSHLVARIALAKDRSEPKNGLTHNPWEAFAKWDAARSDSLEAHHRAVLFLATLTVFAVAIYLLGQALGMGGNAANVLAGLGALFVVFGFIGALSAELRAERAMGEVMVTNACKLDPEAWGPIPDNSTANLAARQFAIGVAYLDTAYTRNTYDLAIDHLRCAVALRPDLAEAQRRLSEAIFSSRSSQMNESYQSLPGRDGLAEILEANQSALRQLEKKGLSPSRLRASVAFDGALAALADHDEFLLEQSEWHARKTLEELPASNQAMASSRAVRAFNFGVILLAAGNRDGALATYREALETKNLEKDFLLSAITDLHAVLALRCPDAAKTSGCATLAQDVDKLTADIVRAMPGSDSDLKISLTPGSFTAEVTSSSLTARAEIASAGESSRLVLLWYAIDPAWNAWRVLSDPSGPVARSRAQTKDNKLVVDRSVSNSWACTDPGQYRVEAYLDGVRVGEAEPGLDRPQMTLFRFPDLNLVLCAPERWSRWRGEAETPDTRDAPEHPEGLTEGAMFLPNDGPLALYLRAVPGPRSGRGLNADVLAAVRRLSRDKQPRKMVETREDCSAAAQPGTLLVRAWRTSEGTAELAFGQVPEADATTPGDLICDVLVSVGTLYTPLAPPAP